MSFILSAVIFGAGGAALGGWLSRRRAAAAAALKAVAAPETKAEEKKDEDEEKAKAEVEAEAPTTTDDSTPNVEAGAADAKPKKKAKTRAKPAGETHRLEGFLCQLGDVLTRETGEEAWLAGAVVLSEEIPVAVLFVAPDAGHDCAIYVRPHPRSSLFWLEPLDPSAVLVGGEPPSSVEHRGIRFDRARRLPLRPRRIGVGAPDVGDGVTVAEYASAGAERLLVVKSNNGTTHAYRGFELEAGAYEVIASGDSTL